MSDDVADRAERLLEGVSEGDWGVDPYPHYDLDDWQTDNFSSLTAEELAAAAYYDVDGGNGGWIAHCGEQADAAFIAASRALVPELVAELETTRAEVERLKARPITNIQLDDEQAANVIRNTAAELETTRAQLAQQREAVNFADSILSLLRYRGLVDSEQNRRDVQKASEMLEQLRAGGR